MRAFFISAGLVAVGAAGVQSAFADDATPASPKIWSVAATLRGFYDNNYAIGNNNKDSFGIELNPSINVNASMQQTDVGFKYTYGLYWYQNRQQLGVNPFDQSHQLDFWLDHAFDERWKANLSDTLGVGQEPELINGSGGTGAGNGGVPFRVNGDNLGNHFNIGLDTQWSRQFSTSLHYENDYYDYQNSGFENNTPSLAGELNRVDQNIGLDLQWHLQPETMAFVGYNFDWVDYTANEDIAIAPGSVPGGYYKSDDRNTYSHQFYVGLQHQFTANLGGTVKVGANYQDNYNDPLQDTTDWSPYANLSLTYTYLPGSYAQLGFTHSINSTYITAASADGSLTRDQETSTLYGTINHRITEKLLATVIGQVAFSDYQGGAYSSDSDTDYSLGLNLSYQINRHFSTDVGWNYDNLQSEVPGTAYQRNRVYVGVTATY